jgi:hypothetical protein
MFPFNQKIFPPIHNTFRIFLSCFQDLILLLFFHLHNCSNNLHYL